MNKKKPEKIVYFAATHWDREWYKTVDEFRFTLIPVMDKITQVLSEDPNFKLFTLDGQTSILEDYLTIRKKSNYEETLKTLIEEKRLLIGPWYTMPDEYLVSCESIVQNLMYGHGICEDYHTSSFKTGYVCDTFGHIANLPQILNGFYINSALISRGTNDHDLDCFFKWKAPDGSEVLTFRAPEVCGYGSFFFEVMSEYAPNYKEHLDEITANAIQYVERELTRTSLPFVLLMDGMDHEGIHEFMPEILRRLSVHYDCPVVQERLDEFLDEVGHEVSQHMAEGRATSRVGELADHSKANVMHNKLIPHTLSSRYDLKSANDTCQTLLEFYGMPCSAIDEIKGSDYLYSYITYAYSLLLQNHAHDSICGCSIDAVHQEMLTRFLKVRHTASEYFFRFCEKEYNRSVQYEISDLADNKAGDNKGNVLHKKPSCLVKIFNPLPYEYTGSLEFDIDFDSSFEVQNLPYLKFEQRNSFLIFDEENQELKYNIIQASRQRYVKQFGGNKRLADTHRVAVIGKLKPLGFTTFRIEPYELPYRITERFSTSPTSCENEFIIFEIAPNGTISLTDKRTGRSYSGLHSFLDSGEMGDGWFHIRPIADRCISSLGCPVTIEKTFDGYAECKFVVRYEMRLPSEKVKDYEFYRRSEGYDTCVIQSEFTISRTSPLVSVHTIIDNQVKDHRLQLRFPTNVVSDVYHVNQCNLILSRTTGLDHSHYNWKETDITEKQFESMAFICSDDVATPHGLLFLSKGGLHEVSCPGDRENSMDITLLRCFNKTTKTNGEPDGQLQGKQVFDYALMPMFDEGIEELVRMKDQYVCGYKEFTIPSGAIVTDESAFTFVSDSCVYLTSMPAQKGGSGGNAEVDSKPATGLDSSIIIRVVNYSKDLAPCIIRFARKVASAYSCDYLEGKLEDVQVDGDVVTVMVDGYKMVNLKIGF